MEDESIDCAGSAAEGRCKPGGNFGTKVGADGFNEALGPPAP